LGDAGVGQTCDGFESETCGDCGLTVCEELPDGRVNRYCEPSPAPDVCEENFTCNSEGLCAPDGVPERECGPSDKRPCGECGFETCQGSQWSGVCVADNSACDPGTLCLPEQTDAQVSCQAACSTDGFQMPAWDEEIPDVIGIGEEWDAIDNCPQEDEYRTCYCILDNGSGEPTVECTPCDWF
jgi:hypothetical protein